MRPVSRNRLLAFAAALLSAGLCGAAGQPTVRLAGSDLLGPGFATAVARCARVAGMVADTDFAGTRPAQQALADGKADVGLLLLPPGERPDDNCGISHVVAYQPVVFIVRKDSPLKEMTLPQARRLLAPEGAGETITWADLGIETELSGQRVVLQVLAPETGLALPLARRVLQAGAEPMAAARISGSAAELSAKVGQSGSGSIGLTVGLPESDELRVVAIAQGPNEPAYPPSVPNMATGRYPLHLVLWLSVRREALPRVLPLVRGLLAEESMDCLTPAGFIPVSLAAREELLISLETVP